MNKDQLSRTPKVTIPEAKAIYDRMLSRLVQGENGCVEYSGSRTRAGYGLLTYKGKNYYAHRVAYEAKKGGIGDLCVLHKCDNRACCNPNHLYAGTKMDNMRDMIEKGRENHPAGGDSSRRLSKEDRAYIRSKHMKQSCRQIARDLGVSNYAVYRYVWGKTYEKWNSEETGGYYA